MVTEIKQDLVQELRALFLDGATPSRLIQRLLEVIPTRGVAQISLIDAYFSAAFGNKIYRVGTVDDPLSDLRSAYLNGDVLHVMLQDLPTWRPTVDTTDAAWCDDVEAVDIRVKMREFDPSGEPHLASSWDRLDEKAQAHIRHTMASLSVAREQVGILRMLAERLQQKLFHLERQLSSPEVSSS